MAASAEQDAWIARVLGVRRLGADTGVDAAGALLPIWLDAKDAVDARLSGLQGRLRGFGDPDLDRIAEFGLNGVTGTASVGLTVALREADATAGDAAARARLAAAIASYRGFLDGDEAVRLIDANPFGEQVGLRDTLGDALDRLDRAIAA